MLRAGLPSSSSLLPTVGFGPADRSHLDSPEAREAMFLRRAGRLGTRTPHLARHTSLGLETPAPCPDLLFSALMTSSDLTMHFLIVSRQFVLSPSPLLSLASGNLDSVSPTFSTFQQVLQFAYYAYHLLLPLTSKFCEGLNS